MASWLSVCVSVYVSAYMCLSVGLAGLLLAGEMAGLLPAGGMAGRLAADWSSRLAG